MKKRAKHRELTEVPASFDRNTDEVALELVIEHGFSEGLQRFYEWCSQRDAWEKDNNVSLSPLQFDRTGLPREYIYWRYGKGQLVHRSQF